MSSTPSEKDDRSSNQAAETSVPSQPEASAFNPGWRFYLAFISLTVITLMVALDATSISVALPIMAKALHGSALQAFWSGTSFLLTSTVFQPVIGSFSGIFGRKPMIFFSLAVFGIGVIIATVANDFTVLLVGRSIQGIGGGGVITLTEIVVTDLVPLRLRGQWFSFISSAWAIGTVTGPLLGGGFAQNYSWRAIFWINLPFIGIGSILIILFLRLNYKTSAFAEKLRRVDWIGTLLFTASLTGVLIPLTGGGILYDWNSWRTLFPLILCTFGLVGFVIYEEWLVRKGQEPLINFEVLKTRTGAITYLGTFIHGLVLWCNLYYMPFFFEAIKDFSPIMSGVALFPMTLTVAPFAMITGIVAAITGRYRWATWVGWILTTLGMGLLLLLDLDTSTPAWIFLTLVGGIGTGMLFAAMALAVQASSSNKNMAYAVILFAFFRAFGQTVGVAVGGVVFQNVFKSKLLNYPALAPHAVQYSKDSSALVEIIKAMPPSTEKTQLLMSYMSGLKAIFILCTALAAVAMVASFWTESLPLDRALETEQGFQHKTKGSDEEVKAIES